MLTRIDFFIKKKNLPVSSFKDKKHTGQKDNKKINK